MSKFDQIYNKTLNEVAPLIGAAIARPLIGAAIGTVAKKILGGDDTKEENTNPTQQVQQPNTVTPQQNTNVNSQQMIKDLSAQFAKTNNPADIEKMLNNPETKKALAAILTTK